jgi:hypothetical protein
LIAPAKPPAASKTIVLTASTPGTFQTSTVWGGVMGRNRSWRLVLLLPFIGLLYPPLYATDSPELFGFPFFYWYQLAWVPVAALLTWFVYRRSRSGS